MTHALLSYLPHHLASLIVTQPQIDPREHIQHMQAVVLFADVSGFTPLTEALARNGRRGAEELTRILNAYFSEMITLLEMHGGAVCKFGGDAALVIFPYPREKRVSVTRRAVQCAHAMQAGMTSFAQIRSSVGEFSLAMKIGMARGPVLSASVGDPAFRLEYIIAGEAIDRCAEAEHHAQAGDVVAAPELLADIGQMAIHELRASFGVLRDSARRVRLSPLPMLPTPTADALALLARYTHPGIAQRILAQQLSFVNEHRLVTVLFVRFTNLDYDHDPQALAVLQGFSQELIALIGHYDGFLNRIDMGDKGSKLIILFGAPVAHEDDAERGIRFALDLHRLGHAHGLKLAIGMSSGFVYCGHVGSTQRQEYTVMGDSVNLAARLMQHASNDEILAAESVWLATQQVFNWERLAPLHVKGKREPATVYRTSQLAGSSPAQAEPKQPQLAFNGRSAEQRCLRRLLALALHKRGRVLLLSGEAGMGKSRLLDLLATQARAQQASIYRGQCHTYGASYQGWSSIWRALLGVDEHQPLAEQYAQLEHALAEMNRRLVLRTPLLAGPLGLALPDNDFTRTLEPQLRAELTHSLLLECLRSLANKPLLLLIDNGQWLDSLGLALFELLAAAIDDLPILLVLAARPSPAIQHLHTGQQRHMHKLHLDELLPVDAAAFAKACWSQQQAEIAYAPALEKQILERAQGNPLYIEELISYTCNHPGEAGAVLPESLHQLLISRIDQLDIAHQTTLKAASMLGSSFNMHWLSEGYTQLGGQIQVGQHLEHLQALNFITLEDSKLEHEYHFCHILLQETAYESIAFGTRAGLHEQMGGYLELHRTSENALLDSIAYHYGRSERQDKQRVYFRHAGDAARSAYANSRALDYYQRLLPLLSEAEQVAVLQAMSEIWRLTGEWQAAEVAARQALEYADDAPLVAAEAACTLGAILARTQSYSAALPWFQQAHAALSNTAGAALCRTLEQLSFAYFQLGDLNTALLYAEQQLALAEQIGDQIGCCDATAQIGYIALQRGKNDQALSIQQQVYSQAKAIGYRRRVVLSASDIAEIHWTKGVIEQALEWLLKSLDEANSIGYRWVMGMMIGNAGLIYARHGDDSQALACFQCSLALALELSNRPGITQALGWLASLFVAQRNDQALPICQRAIALARELELVYELSEQLELRARLLLQHQDYVAAIRDCEEALELAQRTEAHEVVQAATQLRIRLLVLSESITKAEACSEIEALLSENPDDSQRVALLLTHWQVDNNQEASKNEALRMLRERYLAEGNASDLRLYTELSDEWLEPPAPLPVLPEDILGTPIELSSLLQRAGVGAKGMRDEG